MRWELPSHPKQICHQSWKAEIRHWWTSSLSNFTCFFCTRRIQSTTKYGCRNNWWRSSIPTVAETSSRNLALVDMKKNWYLQGCKPQVVRRISFIYGRCIIWPWSMHVARVHVSSSEKVSCSQRLGLFMAQFPQNQKNQTKTNSQKFRVCFSIPVNPL